MISEKDSLLVLCTSCFLETSAVEPPIAIPPVSGYHSVSGHQQTAIPKHMDTNAGPKGVRLLEDRTWVPCLQHVINVKEFQGRNICYCLTIEN